MRDFSVPNTMNGMLSRVSLFFVGLQIAAAVAPARDWTKYPPVVVRPAPATLFAVGDAHGDYEHLVRVLIAAHVIAPDLSWAAGSAMLVVTGDMIDKGPRPVDVIGLLKRLRDEAPKSGGEVILLAGNHEAEFLAGPDPKKAADFLADLKRNNISASETAACQGDIGEFLCTLPFAARVGDTFFSHGAAAMLGVSVQQIAASIEKGMNKDGFATRELVSDNSPLEARLADAQEQTLERSAQALGVKHIVQGHQPKTIRFADGVERKPGEMFQRWGVVFLIDTGMSRGVGDSQGAALRFANGKAVAICPDGLETELWSESAHQETGRAAACAN